MSDRKLRIAMIGAGQMANTVHYPSLASFDDVEFAGICDVNLERLTKTADRYRINNRYQDYKQLISETKPDAVYAIGQPHIMFDVWTWCLEQGMNLCIEKPMGLTMHQARTLEYLATKNSCITQVSFQRRSSPMVSALHKQCLQRGPINHAVCRFYKSNMEPFVNARDHMMDDTVHSIDTLRWICGGEVVKIDSVTKRVGVPDINFISATLHFDNGASGYLINSWSSGRRIFSVEMHAPNICVEAEHEGKATVYMDGDTSGTHYDAREFTGSDELYIFAGFQAKNREFVDAVKSNKQPPSNFTDAIKTMEIAEKILARAILSE
ncbi:Gfo/Idh/MocA family oxidoreductase [Alicyclobacillus fastidiosus]|uniref:Gfo/Idh/MocA family oxidoreductase n=1 Tax=Alicyclobacillus fastidiosus TaxID=392011 RepID=A0ABY6ZC46_9BACL|nr:Gfo/Idh/MocA family oxidoreductase [Alicyclobacillus fastidiosus]WAH39831.1 Gfo/Idh/MocA family oxidoreductase [Alicyclobacillus fastidiosus]GMA61088.1 oxidoreductase [Alicyclobacillus fastidiosus]